MARQDDSPQYNAPAGTRGVDNQLPANDGGDLFEELFNSLFANKAGNDVDKLRKAAMDKMKSQGVPMMEQEVQRVMRNMGPQQAPIPNARPIADEMLTDDVAPSVASPPSAPQAPSPSADGGDVLPYLLPGFLAGTSHNTEVQPSNVLHGEILHPEPNGFVRVPIENAQGVQMERMIPVQQAIEEGWIVAGYNAPTMNAIRGAR